MSKARHAAPRRRSAWRPLAAAAAGGAVLLTSGFGVWAGLVATATHAAPQSVTSGTLQLTMAANGAGFNQAVANLAPGDTVQRYVDLTNGGTLAAQALTLGVSSSASNLLVGTDAKSLRVSVTSCSTTWAPATGTCTGGTTTTLVPATTTLAALVSGATTLLPGTVAVGAVTHLQVALYLPDNTEVTTNGTPPPSTVQGLSTTLTWTFTEQQRTATTSNG